MQYKFMYLVTWCIFITFYIFLFLKKIKLQNIKKCFRIPPLQNVVDYRCVSIVRSNSGWLVPQLYSPTLFPNILKIWKLNRWSGLNHFNCTVCINFNVSSVNLKENKCRNSTQIISSVNLKENKRSVQIPCTSYSICCL